MYSISFVEVTVENYWKCELQRVWPHYFLALDASTEDGSVNAVPQILYDQYLILGAFGSYMF